ncbi:MAG: hypothetical protein QM650_13475 [Microlunatus sp.]
MAGRAARSGTRSAQGRLRQVDVTVGSAQAPDAPGRMGVAAEPTALLSYLERLGQWRTARRAELDELDRAALSSASGAGATADITLSMALWKAVADRYEQLVAVWDSGRVGVSEREKLSALIWGRLDAAYANSGLSVSLPEACRLSDALVSQLRVKLGLDISALETTQRIAELRAQLERIRDQVALEPAGANQQAVATTQSKLARRLKEITEKAGRGGDVGGLLPSLEIDAARFERDLIVDAAKRREARAEVEQVRRLRAGLEAREERLRALAAEAVATVDPAPRYAVPDVEALGPVPNTLNRLADYRRRLELVDRALSVADQAYSAALEQHRDLLARLEAYHLKATATGVADQPSVANAYGLATAALAERPTKMALAAQLVSLYQTYLQTVTAS